MRYLNFFLHLPVIKDLKFIFIFIFFMSCSQGELKKEMNNGPYISSGTEKFFLAQLPSWANTSFDGQCFKSQSLQYFNFQKLHESYNLSFLQALELQGQYNEKLLDYYTSLDKKFLKPVEEASMFSLVLENVLGGVKRLKYFSQKTSFVIAQFDSFKSENKLSSLVEQLQNYEQSTLVLFSSCLTTQELKEWANKENLSYLGLQFLSSEWLSSFDQNFQITPRLHFHLRSVLRNSRDIKILKPENVGVTRELIF